MAIGYGVWDTVSEVPVLIIISGRGVVPMDVSSFANWEAYSFRSASILDSMLGFSLCKVDEKYLVLLVYIDRTFAERCREHMKAPSPIYDHFNITGQEVSVANFSIVGREDQSIARPIKEAMLIRVNDPSLSSNIGKFQLPHIWDEVLVKSPELKLK